jgi:hypothetical protein
MLMLVSSIGIFDFSQKEWQGHQQQQEHHNRRNANNSMNAKTSGTPATTSLPQYLLYQHHPLPWAKY